MKKIKCCSLVLSLILLLQCLAFSAGATQATLPQIPEDTTEQTQAVEELTFGTVCVSV